MKLIKYIVVLISFIGYSQIPNGYYSTATGTGFTLKSQLKSIIDDVDDGNGQSTHNTGLGYSSLWQLFETSDKRANDFVWDIYSDCDFKFVIDQDNGIGGTTQCDKFNREHSFPQSWYGGSNSHPMRADVHHVFPTDKKVNSERGNLAFGEVSSASFTSNNGSKRGISALSGPTGQVFEPIDEYKGDLARAYFYVATRYENEISNWEAFDTGGDSMLDGSSTVVFESWALTMLYQWHLSDPVSQKEIDRNNAIFNHQGNRNPYVDHPEYVHQVWETHLLSFKDNKINQFLNVFPNPIQPNNPWLHITSSHKIQKIEIFTILGKKVLSKKPEDQNSKIHLGTIKSGVYLMKIQMNNKMISRKLLIL